MQKFSNIVKLSIIVLMYISVPVLLFTYDDFLLLLVGAFLISIPINAFAFSTVYHKLFAHRTFSPKTWVPYIGTLLAVLIMLPSPRTFLSQHRLHHKFSDTEYDPHSPKFGKLSTFFPYFFKSTGNKNCNENIRKNVSKDFAKDYPVLNQLSDNAAFLIFTMFNIGLLLLGVDFFIFSMLVCLVNLILHGYANTFFHEFQRNGEVTIINKPMGAKFISPEFNHARHHELASSYDFSTPDAKDWMVPIIERFLKK